MEIIVNKFLECLIEENTRQNLVSRKAGRDELLTHIEDSRKLLDFYSLDNKRVIDIGSGAGFPAIILAIFCPGTEFVLVEADLKKNGFLEQVSKEINLKNVTVIRERVELLGKNTDYRDKFDICTSRAVAAMNIMLEYGMPLVKKGGSLLLWKGKNFQAEIDQAAHALDVLHGRVEDVYMYSLVEEKDRTIVVVSKEGETPEQYPRRVGVPAKRPI